MNEAFPVNSTHEQRLADMQPMLEYELRNQQLIIDANSQPLLSRDEAVEAFGINGDIIATITLPGQEESREVAVVDYGEPDPNSPLPLTIFEGQALPMMGVARERYGLRALNYVPDKHLSSHVGFSDGTTITLGRNNTNSPGNYDANFKLGLTPDNHDTDLISRRHATITLKEGKLTIADHSTNGSLLRIANPEQRERTLSPQEMHQELGNKMLQGVGVQEVSNDMSQQAAMQNTYGRLASMAEQLGSGTVEPAVTARNMNSILQSVPDDYRESFADIQMLVNDLVDDHGRVANRYTTGDVARQIRALAQKRAEGTQAT